MALFRRSLTIDHIDGKGYYSKEKNNDPNNLVTLCCRCHGRKDGKRARPFSELPEESKKKILANLNRLGRTNYKKSKREKED
jgi:cytochrome c553